MILTTRTVLVLSAILVLSLANYMTANGSDITNFMLGSAFAQTDTTGGSNPSDPNTIPQDNSTDLGAIPQDNTADPYAIPQDNSTALTAGLDNNLTNTQNQTSNAVTPEFGPVSVLVLTIGVISIILVSMRSRFSWNIK